MRRPTRVLIIRVILALFCCLAPMGVFGAPAGLARSRAAAGQAVVQVQPGSVLAGRTVSVTGSGFRPSEPVSLQLEGTGTAVHGSVQLLAITADGAGSFAIGNVPIPAGTPAGAYYLRAVGLQSNTTARTRLEVQVPRTTIRASSTNLTPNQDISVSGTGFNPDETIALSLNTPSGNASVPLGTTKADGSGGFSTRVHIPFGVPAGQLRLVASGQSSSRQASEVVNVTAPTAALRLSASSVLPGATITIVGKHFQPGETVNVDLVALSTGARLGTATADQAGSFALNNAVVPPNTPQGSASVVATGASSRLSATAQLTIGARQVSLSANPTTLEAGKTLDLRGHGYVPGETVVLVLKGGSISQISLASVIAVTDGSFAVNNLAIPSYVPAGSYTLTAAGQASGRAATVVLTIQAPPAASPILSILDASRQPGQPYSLSPGGFVRIAGSSFPANTQVTLVLAGGSGSQTLTTVTTSAGGSFGPIGLTIPAITAAGSYRVEAVVGGKAVASLPAQVSIRTVRLTISTATLVPGENVTVQGTGFAPGEQVVLALNGAALATKPATVIANTGGSFTLSFVVPQTISGGANTLTASGVSSRASVTQVVQAQRSVTTRWYFANGDTTSGAQSVITLLNTQAEPANVTMTFLYQAGAEQTYKQVVQAHSVATVDLNLVAGAGRHVSTIVAADRQISATSSVTYAGSDTDTTPGASGPGKIWYLAEGYTNGSFRETLEIMNPGTTYTTVDVRFLPFNDRPISQTRFVMQPRSNITVDAGQYVPGQSISAIVTADHDVVVERTMRFGAGGRGVHDKVGTATASTVWAFSQGESSPTHQTFFTILNPNPAAPAAVTATFYNAAGKPVGSQTVVVNALRRGNIKLNDALPTGQVATVLTSNVPVVVERPDYESGTNLSTAPSGSVIFGRNGGTLQSQFPAGSTANGDHSQIYLFNPGVTVTQLKVTFYTPAGATQSRELTLAPNSDTILDLNTVDGLAPGPVGALLRSANNQPFIAEEAVINPVTLHASAIQGISQ